MIALLLFSLMISCTFAAQEVYAVEWLSLANETGRTFAELVNTITIDPVTGELTTLMNNLVHTSGDYSISPLSSSRNPKTNELYYMLDLSVPNKASYINPVYSVDLENRRLLPSIVFDIHTIMDVAYDYLNDRLLVAGFLTVPSGDPVLMSYDFKTHKTETLYYFDDQIRLRYVYSVFDVENQQLYFITSDLNIAALDLNTLKPRFFAIYCQPSIPIKGSYGFDPAIGLYGLGYHIDFLKGTETIFYNQYSEKTGTCISTSIYTGPEPVQYQASDYNPETKDLFIIVSTAENRVDGKKIMTYNVGAQKVTNYVPLSRKTYIIELAAVSTK